MKRRTALIALLGCVAGTVACAVHEPVPVFRAAVFVGERGISVPLPPPSLIQQPKQDVDVDGEVDGDASVEPGTVLRVVDNRGDGDVEVELEEGVRSFSVSLTIDVSDSCLEMWLVAPSGAQSEHRLFSTRIVAEQDLEVLPQCRE